MKKYIFYSIIILLLNTCSVAAQKNLLSNGSFEDGLSNWEAGNAKVTNMVRKSGQVSLALVAYVRGKWEGIDQKVKLPKNSKAIVITGSYKLDEVEQGANAWNTAVIILEFTAGDKKLGDGIPLIEKTGTEDWTSFKKNLRVPDEATGFRLMIALNEASGTFFVDDLNAKVISIDDFEKETTVSKTKDHEN
jgi:hypothetical protein